MEMRETNGDLRTEEGNLGIDATFVDGFDLDDDEERMRRRRRRTTFNQRNSGDRQRWNM